MLVYHTSDQCFDSPDVRHSRDALDFGKGFYVTRLIEHADKYSSRFLRAGKDAYLHILEYTPDPEMRIRIFGLKGGVANDKVFQTVDLYMAGVYNKEQALQNLVYEMPNNQLCFITQEAIDRCLKFIEHRKYTHG